MQADHGDFVSRTLEEPHGVEVIFDWLGFVMSFAHHGQPPRSDALHHRVTPRSDVPYACMRMRLQKRKARPNMSQYYWRFGLSYRPTSFLECLFVDLLQVEGLTYLHADVVSDHQLGQLFAVDKPQAHADIFCELLCAR